MYKKKQKQISKKKKNIKLEKKTGGRMEAKTLDGEIMKTLREEFSLKGKCTLDTFSEKDLLRVLVNDDFSYSGNDRECRIQICYHIATSYKRHREKGSCDPLSEDTLQLHLQLANTWV